MTEMLPTLALDDEQAGFCKGLESNFSIKTKVFPKKYE